MIDNAKSLQNKNRKQSKQTSGDYNQQEQEQDNEAQFKRKHQLYIAEKIARRKQMRKIKQDNYGPSSSSDEEINSNIGKVQRFTKKIEQNIESTELSKQQHVQQLLIVKSNSESSRSYKIILQQDIKNKEWKEELLLIHHSYIKIGTEVIEMNKITKLKIYSSAGFDDFFKIKITIKNKQIIIGASVAKKNKINGLIEHYYIFMSIINAKLAQQNISINPPTIPNSVGLSNELINHSKIYGKLLKKSKMFGKYDESLVIINQDGLQSYKKMKQKPSLIIQSRSVKEMWTRFQMEGNLLWIKLLHQHKNQFGIPVNDYSKIPNWLYHFYELTGLVQ